MFPNYARTLELKKYETVNEPAVYEADKDPNAALAQVKSGMNGGAYTNQWNQLTSHIKTEYEAGKTSGTFMVKHDANIGGADMVNVAWSIDNGKVTLSVAQDASAQAATPAAASKEVKDAAQKIWIALEGSAFTEDEAAVADVFRDDITNDADLQSLLVYWKSLKIPFLAGGSTWYNRSSLAKTAEAYKDNKPGQWNQPLEFWISGLLNSDEISRVNDNISKYSKFRFKAR